MNNESLRRQLAVDLGNPPPTISVRDDQGMMVLLPRHDGFVGFILGCGDLNALTIGMCLVGSEL
jgi:hypothetical protein